jgi:hypothetical protein
MRRFSQTYGYPRIHAELAAANVRISKKRAARTMKEIGIQGVSRKGKRRASNKQQQHRLRRTWLRETLWQIGLTRYGLRISPIYRHGRDGCFVRCNRCF